MLHGYDSEFIESGTAFVAPVPDQSAAMMFVKGPEKMSAPAEKLLDAATTPGPGPEIDFKVMSRSQTFQIFAEPASVTFEIRAEASLDGVHWFPFGIFTAPAVTSEDQHTVQFVRANLAKVNGGAVSMLVGWS